MSLEELQNIQDPTTWMIDPTDEDLEDLQSIREFYSRKGEVDDNWVEHLE